jgi:hypothetical protein
VLFDQSPRSFDGRVHLIGLTPMLLCEALNRSAARDIQLFCHITKFSDHRLVGDVLYRDTGGLMTNIDDYRKLSCFKCDCPQYLGNWSSHQFFVDLCELAANDNSKVAELREDFLQGLADAMRSLEENGRGFRTGEVQKPLFAVFRPSQRKSEKNKGLRRKARHC